MNGRIVQMGTFGSRKFAIMAFGIFLVLQFGSLPAAVQWLETMAGAQQAREDLKKPVLVYLYNHQARPAKVMTDETLNDPRVAVRLENFVCVRINSQEQADLARQYGLIKVPTTIFLSAAGTEIDRAVGLKPADEFVQYLDRITTAQSAADTSSKDGGTATIMPFESAAVDLLTPKPGTQPVRITYASSAPEQAYLVGDFNDWRTDVNPMTRNNGVWELTTHLREGAYEYLIHIDGEYHRDPNAKWSRPNPYEGLNSVVLVGNPKQSPTVQGNSAYFMLYDAKASRIEVAGSFNNWEMFTMFRKPDDPGMWGVRYDHLPPGEHQYKYIIDGTWTTDPENYTPTMDHEKNINSTFMIK